MIQKKTLHILNGMGMYKYFKKAHFLESELMIPFNEAMCYGNTCDDIFSDEFTEIRAKVHHITPAQYAEITLNPLQPLFYEDFNRIVLWFDDDMFCQINLLTILAWLDRTNFKDAIELQIVGDNFQSVGCFTLKPKGYYALYKQVLIHKKIPQDVHPGSLKKGIELYLNYLNKESELMLYIQKHQNVPAKELVLVLIENFKDYGLGDTQYLEIIESFRKKVFDMEE
ncbi:AraC family transcriptional regulator [Lysinibacillus yapensis]|uniref:AraC family transcriptional regulator n=1 Tax=Ureibacillus yapensis TaxID=2304605 RepID=A0A396SNJ0_9BACL|nr:AraC family transcriptional regulator [Lysinibacillus yapensis]RHW37410.1 AraC family transcriptional regulator [Lysinibacillus yapensis]